MKKSVCIIGAGIGGLTAGAFLAKEGYKVTLLEKATTVGGSAGWYMRKNRMFPTGATIGFGLEEGGILKTLLNQLDIKLPTIELQHPMDVILPSGKVSIFKDITTWEEELKNAFPDRIEDVLKFWDSLNKLAETVLAVTKSGASLPIQRLYDMGSLPEYAIRHPLSLLRVARYALWTVEDLMRKYNLASYEPLRQFLNAQLLDAVQIDITKAALLPSSLALTIYRNGSFFVQNGMGQLSKALAERMVELGGELLLSSPVQRISYKHKSRKWAVESRKCNSSFDFIINNSGISFGPGTSYSDSKEFSWGAFRIDGILNNEVREGPLKGIQLPFAYQIVPASDKDFLNTHGPIYVTFQETKDSQGQTIEGEVTMTISVHTDFSKWHSYSKVEYQDNKAWLRDALLDAINEVIPVKDYIVFAEAGTPLTYKKFLGKSEVGGFPLTVANAVTRPKSIRTALPQFFLAGEQVFPGPGTLSSALSGYYSARAIMKEK